jgi:hypothetical protein
MVGIGIEMAVRASGMTVAAILRLQSAVWKAGKSAVGWPIAA